METKLIFIVRFVKVVFEPSRFVWESIHPYEVFLAVILEMFFVWMIIEFELIPSTRRQSVMHFEVFRRIAADSIGELWVAPDA